MINLLNSKAFDNPQNNDFNKTKFDSFLQQLYGNETIEHKHDKEGKIISDRQTEDEFNAQLELLLGLYVKIIESYFNGSMQFDLIARFQDYISRLKDSTYYNREASSYNLVKGMLEKIVFYLRELETDQDPSLEERKKKVKDCLKEMYSAFVPNKCKIGVMEFLQKIHEHFNDGTSLAILSLNLTNIYTKKRETILRQLADFHKQKNKIKWGNQVHVNFRFSQISQSLGLGIPLDKNAQKTQDIITGARLHIDDSTSEWIKTEFYKRFNYSALIDEFVVVLRDLLLEKEYQGNNLADKNTYKKFIENIHLLLNDTDDSKSEFSLYDIFDYDEKYIPAIKESLFTNPEELPEFCEKFLIKNGFVKEPRTYSGFWSNESQTMPNLKRLELAVKNQDFYVIKKFLDEIKQAGMLSRFCSIAIKQGDLRTARLFIKNGAELQGDQLLKATENGLWAIVSNYIKDYSDQVKVKPKILNQLFEIALYQKDDKKVQFIVAQAAIIDPKLLGHWIAEKKCRWRDVANSLSLAQENVQNKSVNGEDKAWESLLCLAALADSRDQAAFEVVQILLDHYKINPNILTDGVSPRSLKVGDTCQVIDRVNKEYSAKILARKDNKKVCVHYLGWPKNWDEWLDLTHAATLTRFPTLPGRLGVSLLELALEKNDNGKLASLLLAYGARLQVEQLVKAAKNKFWESVSGFIKDHTGQAQVKPEILDQICNIALYQNNIHEVEFLVTQGATFDPKLLDQFIVEKKFKWRDVAKYLRIVQVEQINKKEKGWEDLLCQAALADPRDAGALEVVVKLLNKYNINPNVSIEGINPGLLKVGDTCDVIDIQRKQYKAKILRRHYTSVHVHYEGWPDKWDEWIDVVQQPKRFPALPVEHIPLLDFALARQDGGELATFLLNSLLKSGALQKEQLIKAANNQLWPFVECYIDQHHNTLEVNPEILNQLCSIAIEQNNTRIIELCAVYGADILSSLKLVAEAKHWDIVKIYIQEPHKGLEVEALNELCNIAIAQGEEDSVQFLINQGVFIDPKILHAQVIQGKCSWEKIAEYLKIAQDQPINREDEAWGSLLCQAALVNPADNATSKVVDILLDSYNIDPNISGEVSSPDFLNAGDRCLVIDQVKKKCQAEILRRENNQVYVHYVGWSDKWNQWIDVAQHPERFSELPLKRVPLLDIALTRKEGGELVLKLLKKIDTDRLNLNAQQKEVLLHVLAHVLVNSNEEEFFDLAHKLNLDPKKTVCEYIELKNWKVGKLCFSQVNMKPTPRYFAQFHKTFSNDPSVGCFFRPKKLSEFEQTFRQADSYSFFGRRSTLPQTDYECVADYLSNYTNSSP